MVKNRPVIHLSIGTVMRLAILKHAQKSRGKNKASSAKQDQSSDTATKASQNMYKQKSYDNCLSSRGLKTGKGRVHMATNKPGQGDLMVLGDWFGGLGEGQGGQYGAWRSTLSPP